MITVNRDDLANALAKVRGIVRRSNIIPILGCCKIQASGGIATVSTSDMDLHASTTMSVEGSGDFQIALDAHALSDWIGRLPRGVSVAIDRDGKISSGRMRSTISPLDAETFPQAMEQDEIARIVLSADDVSHLLVLPCKSASNEETRAYLCGVTLGCQSGAVTGVASDGKTVIKSTRRADVEDFEHIIVPSTAISALAPMLDGSDVEIGVSESSISFKNDGFFLQSRLIAGTPANFDNVIRDQFSRSASVDRCELLTALDRVGCLTDHKEHWVRLKMNGGPMVIESAVSGAKSASEEIDVSFDDDAFEIGFNARQLALLAGCMPSETIEIRMNGATDPVCVWDKAHEGTTIIMPVRV